MPDYVNKRDCLESIKRIGNDTKIYFDEKSRDLTEDIKEYIDNKFSGVIWLVNFFKSNLKWFLGVSVATLAFCLWFGFRLNEWMDNNYVSKVELQTINYKLDVLIKKNSDPQKASYLAADYREQEQK